MQNKPIFSSDFTLGILGGGQLGKMLLYETRKMDIRTSVIDPAQDAPSKPGCNRFVCGDFKDYNQVMAFGKTADLITIEIENVNTEALKELQAAGKKVYPSPETIELIKNKISQKRFYAEHHLPTAAFSTYSSLDELKNNAPPFPFVWKSATGGYDGRGVQICRSIKDLNTLPEGACLSEALIDFKTELAVIVARSTTGEQKAYPVVEMEFHPEANQVEYVLCPARIPKSIAQKATEIALAVSQQLQNIGILAVELFLTKKNEILINEVAPRPHNSGHYSIEGAYTNQFEQHLRAILGLPLGNTASKTAAVMVNLVGEENHTGSVIYQGVEEILKIPGTQLHIYGKKETRPFRKMGHITITAPNIDAARENAARVKNNIKVISNHA